MIENHKQENSDDENNGSSEENDAFGRAEFDLKKKDLNIF